MDLGAFDRLMEHLMDQAEQNHNSFAWVCPSAFYDAWLAHQNESATNGREAIDDRNSKSYRFIWQAWTKFIAAEQLIEDHRDADWQRATPVMVDNFLKHGMRRLKHDQPSEISKRRYWTVLSRLYHFAHLKGHVPKNPVLDLAMGDVPPIEVSFATILNPSQFHACFDCLPPATGTATQVRDRAIALLLLTLALSPEEIRNLGMQDLERDMATGRVTAINVVPKRSVYQQRRMELNEQTSDALTFWLTQRRLFNSLKKVQPTEMPVLGAEGDRDPFTTLFVSQKSAYLTMDTLRHVGVDLIERACNKVGQQAPPRVGPQIIRNTVLTHWLNEGKETGVVARMAGLKNAKGLAHLKKVVRPDVRHKLVAGNRRDGTLPILPITEHNKSLF